MHDNQNIEESQEDRKSESPQEEMNDNILQQPIIEPTETTNRKSEIQKSEIKNMEVHHHPDLHHRRKHFKEYFLEFLMIFLAVTLGFFAENYREHLGDNSKEKEFMKSIISDLEADTNTMRRELYYGNLSIANTDSVLFILRQPLYPQNVKSLYNLIGNDFYRFNNFKYHNRTVEELKSSGDFRLIRYKVIADSIMSYDNNMKYVLYTIDGLQTMMFQFKEAEEKVFDYKYYNPGNYLKNFTISVTDTLPALLTSDKLLTSQYYNSLFNYSLLSSLYVKLLYQLKLEAIDLLKLINKQYNLQ